MLGYRRWHLATWIVAANAAMHLLKVVALALGSPGLIALLVLSPAGMAEGQYWQLLTYMWLHGDLWHLAFNMAGVYWLGRAVEDRIGARRFMWLYLTGGLAGGIFWWLANLGTRTFLLGASGAVLAVVMAFAVLYPRAPITLFPIPITVQARWLAVFYVIFSGVMALEQGGRIAHIAHLGGLIVGFIYIRVLGLAHEPMFWWRGLRMPRFPYPRPPREGQGGRESDTLATSDEIDAILEKISKHGFHSLTPREKKTLEQASGKK